jgi:mono/diheme cytochrome c family protein
MGCRAVALTFLLALAASPQASQTPHGTPLEERLQRGREFLGLGPPPNAAAAALGQKLFSSNCSFCHGADATGGEGPNLIRSSLVLHDEKGESIAPVVQNGRPEKGMPAFGTFTPEQLYDIAEFLHQRVYDAANRWGYKIGDIVTGDPAAGRTFFNGHCTRCHSSSGDLAHIGAKYSPPDLQAVFLYPGSLLHVPVSVTVDTPEHQRVRGTVVAEDDFTIVIKEDSGRIASWRTDQITFEVHDPLEPHRALLPQYTDSDMHNVLAYLVTLK